MRTYLLFGFKEDLESSRLKVEASFKICLESHESAYRGGEYYRLKDIGEEHFVLQRNLELDNELAEDEFPNYTTLLYVNETERKEEIIALLAMNAHSGVFLRREDLI